MSGYHEPGSGSVLTAIQDRFRAILDGLMTFWFKPTDLTTLAVMRICTGLLFTYILIVYAVDLPKYVGRDAFVDSELIWELRYKQPTWRDTQTWERPSDEPLPAEKEKREALLRYWREWETDERKIYKEGIPAWSIYFHVSDPTGIWVVHGLIILTSVLFTIGLCTRVTAVLMWVAGVSYVNRATTTFFGMDTMLNLLLIYGMVAGVCGASGAMLSVDRLVVRWWARRGKGTSRRPEEPAPSHFSRVAGNFVTRLIQINFCIIYMASGLSKLQGASWWNGNAMWGVMANPEFNPLDIGPYMAYLTFLCKHRWLWEFAMHAGSLFTLGLEISFAYLVWLPRWRWVMITGAVMLHTGIALVMGLVGFSLAMLTLLLAFVPPETVRRMVTLIKGQLQPLIELVMRAPADSEKLALSR